MGTLKIDGEDRSYSFNEGESLLDILQDNGIIIESPCGGKGYCGKCKVQILSGNLNIPTEEEIKYLSKEELDKGVRLSCLNYPEGEITIKLLNKETVNHRILTDGYMPKVELNSIIHKQVVNLKKPTLESNISFEGLLEESIGKQLEMEDTVILEGLAKAYKGDIATLVFYENRLIGIEQGDTKNILYGAAVDIGTTTVVVSLVDLNTGKEIASETAINPQKEYGLDVLSRIDFARRKENGVEILQRVIVECLNSLIKILCEENKITKENIYEIAIGANATMMHLLLGIDTYAIGKSPYATVFCKKKNISAKSIGLSISPFGRLYCLPGVSSYIGADIVAGVVVADLKRTKDNVLFIDIGTNGEIVLSRKGELVSCSCAAGPALEGANISCGMRAADGAIEGIQINKEGVFLNVISNNKPQGICGSGILEAISEIWRNGLINKSGRLKRQEDFEPDELNIIAKNLLEDGKKRKFIIYKDEKVDICITQDDIRQVQLAKGAISSGFYTLLDLMNIGMEDLDSVVIAGQFGKHLKVDSLTGVGIIPKKLGHKVKYIGNSSKTGAMMCLLSRDARQEMERVAKDIKYFELSTNKSYEKLFTSCLTFD